MYTSNNSGNPVVNRKRKNGFTLLECILALTIFSIIIISVYSVFRSGIKAYRSSDVLTEQVRRARWLMSDISREIRNIAYYPGVCFQGNGTSMSFFTLLPLFEGSSMDTPRPYRITYKVERDANTETSSLTKSSMNLLDQHSDTVLTRGFIKDMKFSFYQSGDDEGAGWMDSWDGSGKLPALVKIELVVGDTAQTNEDLQFTEVVPIPSGQKIHTGGD